MELEEIIVKLQEVAVMQGRQIEKLEKEVEYLKSFMQPIKIENVNTEWNKALDYAEKKLKELYK